MPRAGTVTLFGPRTLTRTTGAPNVFTFNFVTGAAAAPYVLHIDNHGVTSGVVTLNGVQILGPNDFKASGRDDWMKDRDWDDDDWYRDGSSGQDRGDKDRKAGDSKDRRDGADNDRKDRDDEWRGDHDWKAVIERTVSLRPTGGNVLRIELRSKPGTHLSVRIDGTAAVTDTTPPVITAVVSPAPNSAAWNRTDVQVSFVCSDTGSGIATCPAVQTLSTAGANQIVRGTATDKAGNTAVATATVSIDTTPPTITAAVSPAPNASGWIGSDATITFTCQDALSGIASCPPPIAVTVDGAQTFTGTARDRAGNDATAAITVTIVKTGPSIVAAAAPPPNANGWNRTPVIVTFICSSAAGTEALACPAPVSVTAEGANQVITRSVVDAAGRKADASVTLNIDTTAPAITAAVSPPPNAGGFVDSDATVTFTCTDAGSGIAACPEPITITTEGPQTLTRAAIDRAGNEATATVTLQVVKTRPSITATTAPAANANGWNRTAVVVSFACSGSLACPSPVTVTTEGANQVITRSVVDAAGHTAAATATLNIDTTAPALTAAVSPPPNAGGFVDSDATVTFTCTDAGSGIAACPEPITITTEGPQTLTRAAVDRAGNEATTTVTLQVVKTRPSITATITPAANANGWNQTAVVVSFVCSGSLACPSPVTVTTEGADQAITRSVVDTAGHTAAATVTLNIDTTRPTIAAAVSPTPRPDGTVDGGATVTFTCSDALSGIASCPPPVTIAAAGPSTVARTAVDRAGNEATATVSVTVNTASAAPTISATVTPPANADGWHRGDVVVTFVCAGGSGALSCPAPVTVTTEGANQVIARSVTDAAGHSASAAVTLNIDRSAPVVTATASPAANAAGWHRGNVVVSFACRDALSGVASCPAPITDSSETGGQITGTVTDRAGNTATAALLVKIDRAPPTIVITTPADGASVETSSTVVSGTIVDSLSGIASAACGDASATVTAGGAFTCPAVLIDGQNALAVSAIDAAGNVATSQLSVTLTVNHPPVADAGAGYSGAVGAPLSFSGAGSADPDHDSLSYAWSFGDGATGSGVTVTHTYSRVGAYDVTLTVTDAKGLSRTATTSASIVQPNRAPVATANGPYTGITGTPLTFSGSAIDPDNDPLTYVWSFADGGTAFGSTVSHTYTAAGASTATLTASDGQLSGTATASVQVSLANRPPTVTAGGPYTGVSGAAVAFAATGSDPDGDALTYRWDFGDGTSAAGRTATHTFAQPGTFETVATVNDGRGGSTSVAAAVTIAQANRAPHAAAGGPYAGQARSRLLFTAASSSDADGDTLTYAWTFGDGSTGTGVAPNHGYAAAGVYTASVTVADGRGGHDSASTEVTVVAPPAVENGPPIARPGGPYSSAAAVVVALNGSASSDPDGDPLSYVWTFGDGSSGTGPSPAHVYANAGTFTIALAVSDGHSHTVVAETSATVSAATDRAPPSVSLSAPARVLPGTEVLVTATATDNVGVESVTIEVDGGSPGAITTPPYQRLVVIPAVAAPGATIRVRATAVDAGGNRGTADATITIDAAPDGEKPVVTLNAPAEATPGSQIHLTATAADNVGIASVDFSADGAPIATVPAAPYESTYSVPATATPGAQLTFTARASDFTGNDATATATVAVVQTADTTPPVVTVSAPAVVAPGAGLNITADAFDSGGIASVEFYVDGVRIATVAQPPYRAAFAVPPTAVPGSILRVEARVSDFANLEGRAAAQTIVGAAAGALVIGEVFDDSTGLLLAGAAITLSGADSSGVAYTESATTDARGRFMLRAAGGHGIVSVTRNGMTQVDRAVDLQNGAVVELLDSRLTPLATPMTLSGVLGGAATSGAASISVPAGAAPGAVTLTLTPVSAQGLQGPLPLGWAPLAALDIAPHAMALHGAIVSVPNARHAAAGTPFVLAQWDAAAAVWRAVGDASVSADERTVQGTIELTGALAILVADTLPSAPIHPNSGDLLAGVAAASIAADALSLVTPTPKVIFYSPGVKSDVVAASTAAAPLPSGTVVWSRITESYRFVAGGETHPEPYTADLVFYQRPLDATSQSASYVVSPSLVFDPLTLADGVIKVELFARPDVATPIAAIGPDGGLLTAATGESIQVPSGAAAGAVPVQIAGLEVDELGMPVPDGLEWLGGMRLTFTGALAQPAIVSVPVPPLLGDATGILLVRLQELQERTRLVLVGGAHIVGNRIVSTVSLEGASQQFEGVRTAGRYAFVHTTALVGFAAGLVTGVDDLPFVGALVTTPTLPIVSQSRGAAGYIAAAAVGSAVLTATDLARADASTGALTLARQDEVRALDLHLVAQPPRVTSILPSNASTNVSPTTAVVITFSEAIDPESVSGARAANIVLAGADGAVVPATLALSSGNSVATLRPIATLEANTAYTASVTAGVKDLSGYALAPPASAAFTTLDTVPPLPPAAGAVTADIPVNGATTVRASQGTAGAHDHVTLVNLTTGQISPVIVLGNGAFTTTIAASAKDKLRLRIVDDAGNETAVDLARFSRINADGSVSAAVGTEGGHVSGPGGTAVDISPGTFPDGAIVTINPVTEAEFPVQLTAAQKAFLSYAGGVRVDFGGVTPAKYVNVSIPAGPDDHPGEQWVVSAATEVNGRMVLNVVDTAKLIAGRIQTSSPPCPGVTGSAVYGIHKSKRAFGLNYGQMYASGWGGLQVDTQVTDESIFFIDLPFLSYTPSLPTPMCLPTLSGNVSVGANRQRVTIPAAALAPADREVVITSEDGNGLPTASHFPKNSVYYTFEVPGKDTDSVSVFVTDSTTPLGSPTPVPNVRVSRATATSVLVAFSPDVLKSPGVTQVTIHNARTGIDTAFLQAQVNYVVSVPGPAGSVSAVRVIDVDGAVRQIANFTVSSPSGPERLMVKAVAGTIDPTWAQLDDLPPADVPFGARGVVDVVITVARPGLGQHDIHVPADARVDGGFNIGVDALLTDTFSVKQVYANHDGTNTSVDSVKIPTFSVTVSNPVTGTVLRTFVVRAPGAGDELNLGTITDDVQAPYITASPSRPQSFDPAAPLAFTFSESMDAASVQLNMTVQQVGGAMVAGHWRMSDGDRVATFKPDEPLRIGESYTVTFNGPASGSGAALTSNPGWITDRAGNPLSKYTLTFKTFLPRIITHFRIDNDDPAYAAAASKPDMPFRDAAIRRKRQPNGTLSTSLVAVTGSAHGSKLVMIDASDPAAMFVTGRTPGGNFKQQVTLVPGIGTGGIQPLTLKAPFHCGNGPQSSTFTGDLAVTTSFNSFFSYISFFDVTRPDDPCLLSDKLLSATPDFISDFSRRGTVRAAGYARAVGVIPTATGFEAYVSVGEVGAMAVDAGKNIPEVLPDSRQLEGLHSGDYRDLAVFNDRMLAADQGGNRLDLLDANLTLLSSLDVAGGPRRVTVAEGFAVDENGDGSIAADEIKDIAVVGEDDPGLLASHVEIVDITNVESLHSIGSVAVDGVVRDIEVDADRHRAFVATYTNAGGKLYVLDLGHLAQPAVQWSIALTSPAYNLTLDKERGLLYVATDDGIDAWSVYDNCCDLAIDFVPKPSPDPTGDRDTLVVREKAALQQGIAAGLVAAAACPGGVSGVMMLEQGSGACLWDPAGPAAGCGKNPNYQPGLSDHDFEVFLTGGVNSCITGKLTEQFVDASGGRKLILLPDGSKMKFEDISFFPVSQAAFVSGELDLDLPPNSGGDDTYGDHGLGRQQLLLKWLLEGEWVSVIPYNLGGADLNSILKKVKVPALEGYEWSKLQEYAFVKSTALVRIKGAADPATALHKLFIKQLHGAGKAGIRAALARMVADDAARTRILTDLDRGRYRTDGCIAVDPLNQDPSAWRTVPCSSFEEWVASAAALTLRGTRLPLFTVADVQKIHRFYRVKADREHIVDEVKADAFVKGVWDFITDAEIRTKAAFVDATTGPHPDPRAAVRLGNITTVTSHTATERGATRLQLVPHVSNRGFVTAQAVEVTMWTGVTAAGTGTRGTPVRDTLMGGDDHWFDYVRTPAGEIAPGPGGKPQPRFELTVDTFVAAAPQGVAFTVDLEERKVKEAFRQNNFNGFYYYLLPATPPSAFVPPAPVPADKLDPDAECDEAPLVQISQGILVNGVEQRDLVTVGFGAHLMIRITVRNLTAKAQSGITVCSSFSPDCYPFPDLAPGAEAHKDVPYTVPSGQTVVLDGVATVRSDSLGIVSGPTTRIVSVPSLYAVVAADASVHPTCLPADAGCNNPSQIMQGGRALRYFRVIDTTTLDKVPGAVVTTKFEGPGLATPRVDTFITDADGIVGTATEPGMPMLYTAQMDGTYTVTAASVNGSPMTAPDLRPLYVIATKPLEYTEGLKTGVSMKIGGKVLGGAGTLGAGGGLSFGLSVTKKTTPIFTGLTIGRSLSAKASLAFEPDVAKFNVSAGFSFKAQGPSASASIGVGVQIGDKYKFPTFPLPAEDRLRLAGLAIETVTAETSIGLPGGPIFAHILGALNNKVTDFRARKTSDSATLSITGAVGLTAFRLNGGFGSSGTALTDYTQEYRASFGLEGAGSVTGTIGAERLVQANQLVASAGISGDISASAGLTLGRTRESNNATSTGNFGEIEFVKKEVEGMLGFSAGISGGLDYSVTLDAAHSYNPVKLEIAFSGKKNFGWNYSGPGMFGTNLANGDQFTRTYTVTDPDTILPMLSTTANIAMLLPQGFSGVVLDSTGSFGMSPTNMYDQLVDLIALLGRNSAFTDSIEKGNGIALPLGFDVSLLGEGAKAGIELNADHSLGFTLASGVLRNNKHYKLEDYPNNLLSLSSASSVLSLYYDALSSTSETSDTFRGVVKTPPGTGTPGSIKSNGSAEIQPASESDYAAVTGLLSFDFSAVPGPVRTLPYRPASVFGPADKPHYGLGGFHQFVPFDQTLGAPAKLILDYHDEELIPGIDKRTIALYQWNKDRSDWDSVPATIDTATNTVRTTITKLGLFTLGPAMPAGEITWSVESTGAVDPNAPQAMRHVVFVSNPMSMNNGSPVPAGTVYHVISTSAAASLDSYAVIGTVTTPDARPDLEGAQITVGADGLLRVAVDYPAAVGNIQLITFSDVGTAFGSPVLAVAPQ
ncbi:MAG: Neogenin [Acidobacteria bacterium]|nr:Neogenin [Acidobacteriota bacterium]